MARSEGRRNCAAAQRKVLQNADTARGPCEPARGASASLARKVKLSVSLAFLDARTACQRERPASTGVTCSWAWPASVPPAAPTSMVVSPRQVDDTGWRTGIHMSRVGVRDVPEERPSVAAVDQRRGIATALPAVHAHRDGAAVRKRPAGS